MQRRNGSLALRWAHPEPPAEGEDDAPSSLNLNDMAHPSPRQVVHGLDAVGRVQPPINSRIPAARGKVVGASTGTEVAAGNAAPVRRLPRTPTFRIPAQKHNVGASSRTSSETEVAAACAAPIRPIPRRPAFRIPATIHNVGASSGTSSETKVQGDYKAEGAAANPHASSSVQKGAESADPEDPDTLELTYIPSSSKSHGTKTSIVSNLQFLFLNC